MSMADVLDSIAKASICTCAALLVGKFLFSIYDRNFPTRSAAQVQIDALASSLEPYTVRQDKFGNTAPVYLGFSFF